MFAGWRKRPCDAGQPDNIASCKKSRVTELPMAIHIGHNWPRRTAAAVEWWTDEWTTGWMYASTDGRTNVRTHGRRDGQTDGRMNGRTDGRTDERTDGRTD